MILYRESLSKLQNNQLICQINYFKTNLAQKFLILKISMSKKIAKEEELILFTQIIKSTILSIKKYKISPKITYKSLVLNLSLEIIEDQFIKVLVLVI